ncbi:MAG: hypothetical protein AAFX81_13405 [Pseudomonadota bacterium]
MRNLVLLTVGAIVGVAGAAQAATLTYSIAGFATGTLGSAAFVDEPLAFTGTAAIDPGAVDLDVPLPGYDVMVDRAAFQFGGLTVPILDEVQLSYQTVPLSDVSFFFVDTFDGGLFTGDEFGGLMSRGTTDVVGSFAGVITDSEVMSSAAGITTPLGGLVFDDMTLLTYTQLVPVPVALPLLVTGLAGLLAWRRVAAMRA